MKCTICGSYPDEITVTPSNTPHPLKELTLRKTQHRVKSKDKELNGTPIYITIKPYGLDDHYYVDDINFKNKTIHAL